MKYFTKNMLILIIAVSIVLVSCSKDSALKNEVYNSANLADLIEKISNDKSFKKEDVEMLSAGIARYGNTPDSINGKKIGDIIDGQTAFLRENSVSGLINTGITTSLGFKYLGWQLQGEGATKSNVFGFILQNRTKSDFKRVVGLMKFVNENNVLIRGFRINVTQPIKSGVASQFSSSFAIDAKNDNDSKLVELLSTKAPNLYVTWQPELIEFADGKKIAVNSTIK